MTVSSGVFKFRKIVRGCESPGSQISWRNLIGCEENPGAFFIGKTLAARIVETTVLIIL